MVNSPVLGVNPEILFLVLDKQNGLNEEAKCIVSIPLQISTRFYPIWRYFIDSHLLMSFFHCIDAPEWTWWFISTKGIKHPPGSRSPWQKRSSSHITSAFRVSKHWQLNGKDLDTIVLLAQAQRALKRNLPMSLTVLILRHLGYLKA